MFPGAGTAASIHHGIHPFITDIHPSTGGITDILHSIHLSMPELYIIPIPIGAITDITDIIPRFAHGRLHTIPDREEEWAVIQLPADPEGLPGFPVPQRAAPVTQVSVLMVCLQGPRVLRHVPAVPV